MRSVNDNYQWQKTALPGLLILFGVFILTVSNAYSGKCYSKAHTKTATPIWSQTPKYNFRSGWRPAKTVGKIRQRSLVYVCGSRSVGFGITTRRWYQIAYWDGKRWRFGWVPADRIQLPKRPRSGFLPDGFSLFPSAHAQGPAHEFGDPPSSTQPPTTSVSPSRTPANANVVSELPNNIHFYLVAFMAMVLGMLAKVCYDVVQSGQKGVFKIHMMRGSAALLVSPMVFLSILMGLGSGVNIQQYQDFIVFMIFAFQNGFFWQNVFVNNASIAAKKAAPA
jgi:hypothetical protein